MGIIGWMLFGLIVGALAKLVMPGRDPGGIAVSSLIGIVGAINRRLHRTSVEPLWPE